MDIKAKIPEIINVAIVTKCIKMTQYIYSEHWISNIDRDGHSVRILMVVRGPPTTHPTACLWYDNTRQPWRAAG